jgi:hypothetical protein
MAALVAGLAADRASGSPRRALEYSRYVQGEAGDAPTTNAPAATEPRTPAEVSVEPPAKAPQPTSFWEGWSGTIEGGLNGSEGNSENLNIRGGIGAERKTERIDTTASFTYKYSTSEGDKTESRGELNARNDWKSVKGSPWGWFLLGRLEYDEFQDWRWRASAYTGPTYALVETEKTKLKLRAGFGFSREFGGEKNEFVPEFDFGVDFEHQLTERQKIFASFDYYPSLLDVPEFRTLARAGWEIIVDPEVNLTLKLGVEHRHQSDPGDDRENNDLDYFALIALKF